MSDKQKAVDSNMKRLSVALYPSGIANAGSGSYHWAFLAGPEDESPTPSEGVRYHVQFDTFEGWVYSEQKVIDVKQSPSLLARILIAKITDHERVATIFRGVPTKQDDPEWVCRNWIAEALSRLAKDDKALGPDSVLEWRIVEQFSRYYVRQKIANETSGRYKRDKSAPRATWDMLEKRELFR